jgi:hypothetical protein
LTTSNIIRNDCVTFKVLGQEINLYSEDMEYGRNTVAEINNHFHHLGNEYPSISAAIFAWQEYNGRDLTNEELHQVMLDNNLISQGI